eukprot:PhM_4_TR10923/c0_g1_i1/m.7039
MAYHQPHTSLSIERQLEEELAQLRRTHAALEQQVALMDQQKQQTEPKIEGPVMALSTPREQPIVASSNQSASTSVVRYGRRAQNSNNKFDADLFGDNSTPQKQQHLEISAWEDGRTQQALGVYKDNIKALIAQPVGQRSPQFHIASGVAVPPPQQILPQPEDVAAEARALRMQIRRKNEGHCNVNLFGGGGGASASTPPAAPSHQQQGHGKRHFSPSPASPEKRETPLSKHLLQQQQQHPFKGKTTPLNRGGGYYGGATEITPKRVRAYVPPPHREADDKNNNNNHVRHGGRGRVFY